jgi:hypothetical protein
MPISVKFIGACAGVLAVCLFVVNQISGPAAVSRAQDESGVSVSVDDPLGTAKPKQVEQGFAAADERSQDETNIWLAGKLYVWFDYCITPDTTPKQISQVKWTVANFIVQYGEEPIKASYAEEYRKGYYEMGKAWCPQADRLIKRLIR